MLDFVERLQCSKAVMCALKGRPQYKKVSKSEADVLIRLLKDSHISQEGLANAIAEVATFGFARADEDALLEAMSNTLLQKSNEVPAAAPENVADGKVKEGKRQNFETFVNFMPASAWQEMKDSGTLSRACEVLVALGLRSPTEHTYRDLAVAYLLASSGAEQARTMSAERRTSFAAVVRRSFATVKKQAAEPPTWELVLEKTPADLKMKRPGVHAAAYNSEPPVAFPFSAVEYEALRTYTRCRKPRGNGLSGSTDVQGAPELMRTVVDMVRMCMGQQQQQLDQPPPNFEIFCSEWSTRVAVAISRKLRRLWGETHRGGRQGGRGRPGGGGAPAS